MSRKATFFHSNSFAIRIFIRFSYFTTEFKDVGNSNPIIIILSELYFAKL